MYQLKRFKWSSHQIIAQLVEEDKIQTILDVGCDLGFIGQLLKNQKKILYGIDKRELSPITGYSKIWQADLDSDRLTFLKGFHFDVVILADILEHLKNPSEVLDNLKPYIKRNGFMIISVPNMDFFLVKILTFFRIKPRMRKGLFDRSHKHDFTYESIKNLLQTIDLKILALQVTPLPLPLISPLFLKGKILHFLYQWTYYICLKFPRLFAYQLILKVQKAY